MAMTVDIERCGTGCFGHFISATDNHYIYGDAIRKTPSSMHGDVRFKLFRGNDESGVSGTGLVLTGVIFSDGTAVVRWCTEAVARSTIVYGTEKDKTGWERFLDIHIQSHPTNDVTICLEDEEGRREWWQQRSDPAVVRKAYIDRLLEQLDKWRETTGDVYPEWVGFHVQNLVERIASLQYHLERQDGE